MARKKNGGGGLGKSIKRARNRENLRKIRKNREDNAENIQEQEGRNKFESILDQNNLEEFMNEAIMANKEFTADHGEVTFVVDDLPQVFTVDRSNNIQPQGNSAKFLLENSLPIPRRPAWNMNMTRGELHESEKKGFLEWRRELAEIEETTNYIITPFEKNINVWRQLWRTVEKSQVVFQIVDARNPLRFRSNYLENYIKELNPRKMNVLILNKADLLTRKQRFKWAFFMKNHNIKSIFFSAHVEQKKIDEMKDEVKVDVDDVNVDDFVPPDNDDWTHIYTREELLCYFKSLIKNFSKKSTENEDQKLYDDNIVIGMVGYPNVGKSSVVNVLSGIKRVAVGSTPGKTKHIQTIPIGKDITLCDCPGLVFPSITTTKQDMVCDGILPIDQMRDYRSPVALVCHRIPKYILELTYGINFKKYGVKRKNMGAVTAIELLGVFAQSRSMMSHKGVPNYPYVARIILKDYVAGKLLYVHPPPSGDKENNAAEELINEKYSDGIDEDVLTNEANEENKQGGHTNDEEEEEEYFTDSGDEDEEEENEENVEENKPEEDEITDTLNLATTETVSSKAPTLADQSFNQDNITVRGLQKKLIKKKLADEKEANKVHVERVVRRSNPKSIQLIEGKLTTEGVKSMKEASGTKVIKLVNEAPDRNEAISKLRQDKSLSKNDKQELKAMKRRFTHLKKFM